ncbi:MAG TPA: hypothetical protein VMB26_01105 [Candidatus Binataceae bacterium]|nr:hypothetical protein [Candidatus Binataceae bacterium]
MEELEKWIDVEAVQLLTHHSSAVISAVLLTALVAFLVQKVLHDGFAKKCILLIDELLIVGLFAWFAFKLFQNMRDSF